MITKFGAPPRPYLPRDWTNDRPRRAKMHVPRAIRFRSLFGLTLLPTEPTVPQQGGTPKFGKLPPGSKASREDERCHHFCSCYVAGGR